MNSSSKPICPIEVKRYAEIKEINTDIKRIQRLLKICGPHVGGSLEYGFVLAVAWKQNIGRIEGNIKSIIKDIRKFENEMKYKSSELHCYDPEGIGGWYFAPIIIENDA